MGASTGQEREQERARAVKTRGAQLQQVNVGLEQRKTGSAESVRV